LVTGLCSLDMSQCVYDWKRFWCPRTAQINLGDRGYLVDPISEWGRFYNPELVDLEAIADIPCLVLLGEPGIGKSQEMDNLKRYTETNIDDNHEVLELNLRSCTNLKDDLFRDEQFIAWKRGTHRLYLFLDSLDEGLLQIQNLATQLVDEFKKDEYHDRFDRLYIRIACRTAIFPSILEEGLKKFWKEKHVGLYELAPLRRIDVYTAVNANGLDADAFLDEVNHKGVVPFAIKPLTLKFLIKKFQENNGQFPAQLKLEDLYLEGCRWLCEEQSSSRRASSRQVGELLVEQRLIIAARIAAVTVFANRFAVWTESSGNAPSEDVFVENFCSGYETANESRFSVTSREKIEEVLDTGLFSSRGSSSRIGWAHQTYAEFLAAWYLKQHNLNLNQILSLIIHPDQRVIPQLQEAAAWLAGMIPEVFQEVMKVDPDILLLSDISKVDDANKEMLVTSLLKSYDENQLPYSYFNHNYQNLDHPGLTEQLQLYICDSEKNKWARYVAIDIAENCRLKIVQNSLAKVALDSQDDYQVRVHALRAVSEFCDEDTKLCLRPLALDNRGDDPDDDLKGYALQAVYPTHMSAEEVLTNLRSTNRESIGGSYQDFIARIFAERLGLDDLLIALKWLETQPIILELNYPFDKLSDSILQKAWEHIEDQKVLSAFARIAFIRIQTSDTIIKSAYSEFKQTISEDDDKCRKLIAEIISIMPDSEQNEWVLLCGGSSLYDQLTLQSRDDLWLLKQLEAAKEKHIQEIYAKIIYQIFHQPGGKNADLASAIIELGKHNSTLREQFALELAPPIELCSQGAEQEKARYEETQRRLSNLSYRDPKPILDPPPKQRVLTALERIESGKPELWWQISTEMTLKATSSHYHFCDKPDLTKFPGWLEAEVDTRKRIIETAKAYLEAGQPEIHKSLDIHHSSNDEFAGYQALYLLFKEEPNFVSTISSQTWVKWIPTILKFTGLCIRDINQDTYGADILKKAYETNRNEVIDTLINFIHQNEYQPLTGYDYDIYRSAKGLIGKPLAKSILSKVSIEDMSSGMLEVLLKDLFDDASDEAKVLALPLVSLPLPILGEERSKAVVSARLLLSYVDNSIWPTIWAAIEQDPKFGREVFESIVRMVIYGKSTRKAFQELKEEYLTDLFVFLERQYPEKEKQEKEKASTSDNVSKLVGVSWRISNADHKIQELKRYIPQWIQEHGTSEACEALRRIICEFPEQADELWLWRLLETEAAARRNTWKPPKPEDILRLTSIQELSAPDLLTPINEINQRTKQMADQPSIAISGGTFNGPVNLAPNQGNQPTTIIGTQNNYFNTDEVFRRETAELHQFIAELEVKHSNIQTQAEADEILNAEIVAVQTESPSWQTLRHQMTLLKRQLLNPERHLQAGKATLVEITKTIYEKSLLLKAIITYIDKLSEEPNHGA
jgi:predicted NACHT family NTPase